MALENVMRVDNGNIIGGDGASKNYSTTEHKVGKWIDGSTLYEKTIDFGALPNATAKQVSAGVSNVNVVDIKGVAIATNVSIPLPHTESVLANCVSLLYTTGAIQIGTGMDRSNLVGYVTIKYTKNS